MTGMEQNSKKEDAVLFKCAKCGKERKKGDGVFVLEGTTFCCKRCCGDIEKAEHMGKKEGVCEFC